MAGRKVSIGTQIDRVFSLREQISADQKKLDEKKKKLEDMKTTLIATMRDAGLEQGRGDSATVTVGETSSPVVEDWEKFYPWLYKNKAGHLMFKRLSSTAYAEMMELRNNRKIPGVNTFTKETLSIRRRTT